MSYLLYIHWELFCKMKRDPHFLNTKSKIVTSRSLDSKGYLFKKEYLNSSWSLRRKKVRMDNILARKRWDLTSSKLVKVKRASETRESKRMDYSATQVIASQRRKINNLRNFDQKTLTLICKSTCALNT